MVDFLFEIELGFGRKDFHLCCEGLALRQLLPVRRLVFDQLLEWSLDWNGRLCVGKVALGEDLLT